MNILCKICYFVIRKCDCIGVFSVAIQSKSFKNLTAIVQNKVKWTFCARFAILLLESVIALVCIWLQFKANHSRMTAIDKVKWTFCARFAILLHWCVFGCNSKQIIQECEIEQNKVEWTFCARFAILLLESVIALVCIWLQFKANHSRMWWQLNRIKWNEHFVQIWYFAIRKCDCISVFGCNSKQIIQECDGNWTE